MEVLPVGAVSSSAQEALELARLAGRVADPWQEHILEYACGERSDGSWAAKTVDILVSRQNGKNIIVEIRELFGAVMLGEYVVHTAHEFKTTKKSYKRLLSLVYGHPDIRSRLLKDPPLASPASGYIMEFAGGGVVEFIARSTSSGRGFTEVDLVIFDEAQELTEDMLGAVLPTMSASSIVGDPQVWYTGSAPSAKSEVWHRRRKAGRKGGTPSSAYFEHSADPDLEDLDDRQAWAQANPGYNIYISDDFIATTERTSMSDEMFAQERLSVSPDLLDGEVVFGEDNWQAVCDPVHRLGDSRFCYGVDANLERTMVGIGASDGDVDELIDRVPLHSPWLERLAGMHAKRPAPVAVDPAGPAGSYIEEFERLGFTVVPVSGRDMAHACEQYYDGVVGRTARVREDARLTAAASSAVKKSVGDGFVWDRKAGGDVSALVAVTVARYAALTAAKKAPVFAY